MTAKQEEPHSVPPQPSMAVKPNTRTRVTNRVTLKAQEWLVKKMKNWKPYSSIKINGRGNECLVDMKNWKPYSSIKNNGRGNECLVRPTNE
jgi:hypothetical protein